MVELSLNSSEIYEKITQAHAPMHFSDEIGRGASPFLWAVQQRLEPLKSKFPCVSLADLYTLAGSVAVETLGGPQVGSDPFSHAKPTQSCGTRMPLPPTAADAPTPLFPLTRK